MKKLSKGMFLATAGLLGMATPALAAGLSANGALVTSYVWRGLDQSADNPAVQGGLDYDFGNGFAVGTWASSIDFRDTGNPGGSDSPMELDLYGSYTMPLTDMLNLSGGVIGYIYPNQSPASPNLDFFEGWAGLAATIDKLTLSGKIYYSPDNLDSDTWYLTGGGSYALTDWLTASANVGYYQWDPGIDDTDWNVGLAAKWKFLTFTAMYTDNDLDGVPGDPNVVGMISFTVAE